jgi:histidinol-phosphate phosphatase family protein
MADKFVIFDRDGTLIDHVHHLADLNQVRIKSDAIYALTSLKKFGFKFGVITNQSVIGRGLASKAQVQEVNLYIINFFLNHNIIFEFFWMCPHTPDRNCSCRKPNIALGKKVINKFNLSPEENYFVGDQETDMEFSKNIGFVPVLIGGINKNNKIAAFTAKSLLDAVDWIINDSTRKQFK